MIDCFLISWVLFARLNMQDLIQIVDIFRRSRTPSSPTILIQSEIIFPHNTYIFLIKIFAAQVSPSHSFEVVLPSLNNTLFLVIWLTKLLFYNWQNYLFGLLFRLYRFLGTWSKKVIFTTLPLQYSWYFSS